MFESLKTFFLMLLLRKLRIQILGLFWLFNVRVAIRLGEGKLWIQKITWWGSGSASLFLPMTRRASVA